MDHAGRDLPPDAHTAVLVPVPVAEPVVGSYRLRFDPSAARGVPAHVTVLFPFLPVSRLAAAVGRVADAVRTVAAFDCSFAGCAWFGAEVLWLAPDPVDPFTRLTEAVWAAFPGFPPFGGMYDEVVPHLTIGHPPLATTAELQAAERAIGPRLPVRCRVDRVWVMAGTQDAGSWRVLHELPLG